MKKGWNKIKFFIHLSVRILTYSLEIFFRLLYHQFARAYDFVAWMVSLGRWNAWVTTAISYLNAEDGDVLEIGPGTGHLQLALHQSGFRVVGLDESKQMCRIATSRINQEGFSAMLVRGYSLYLPFLSKAFCSVIATFPTEYIMEKRTLTEISRVLADGGTLIVIPMAIITGNNPIDRIAAWLFRVTGQAPASDRLDERISEIERRFNSFGLLSRTHRHNLGSSEVFSIVARKISP